MEHRGAQQPGWIEVVTGSMFSGKSEELIRRFSELSNETAGEHFTPREVIRLMVNLLFIEDADALTKPGTISRLAASITSAPSGVAI